jgi:chitodextrinase
MNYTERARALRPYIEKAAVSLTDADALESVELFPTWAAGVAYTVDERIQYGGTLYRVVQAHTSQADWTPDKTPALFVVVSLDEWPEFVQPTGAHDAYKKGDKVTFEGKHYISLIDANVYSPTAYPAGWQEQA